MNKYEVLHSLGEGEYGLVLKCRHRDTNDIVAVKKFKEPASSNEDDLERIRKTTQREISMLKRLHHPHIVCMKQSFRSKQGVQFVILDYMEMNLLQVIELNPNGLNPELVRLFMFQLLQALAYCHSNGAVHRDIKPENLLIDPQTNTLKLCDFGFARILDSNRTMGQIKLTDYVATRWYRAPELLVCHPNYGFEVDIWAVGCILGEISDGQPLFPGRNEVDQLDLIQRMLGPLIPLHDEMFLKCRRHDGVMFVDMSRPKTLQVHYMNKLSQKAMRLIRSLLAMDPAHRPTAEKCLTFPYFDGLKRCDVSLVPQQQQQRQEAHGQPASRGILQALPRIAGNNSSNNNTGVVRHEDNAQNMLPQLAHVQSHSGNSQQQPSQQQPLLSRMVPQQQQQQQNPSSMLLPQNNPQIINNSQQQQPHQNIQQQNSSNQNNQRQQQQNHNQQKSSRRQQELQLFREFSQNTKIRPLSVEPLPQPEEKLLQQQKPQQQEQPRSLQNQQHQQQQQHQNPLQAQHQQSQLKHQDEERIRVPAPQHENTPPLYPHISLAPLDPPALSSRHHTPRQQQQQQQQQSLTNNSNSGSNTPLASLLTPRQPQAPLPMDTTQQQTNAISPRRRNLIRSNTDSLQAPQAAQRLFPSPRAAQPVPQNTTQNSRNQPFVVSQQQQQQQPQHSQFTQQQVQRQSRLPLSPSPSPASLSPVSATVNPSPRTSGQIAVR